MREGEGVGVGIKVATFPGEVRGCVIVQLEEHLDSTELLAGDRFVWREEEGRGRGREGGGREGGGVRE